MPRSSDPARRGARRALAVSLTLSICMLSAVSGCRKGGTPAAEAQASTQQDQTKPEREAIAVRAGSLERGAMHSLYSTSATLRPARQATIIARTVGVVRQLLVEEGDRVKAEQAVARLEDDEQRIAYDKAEAILETKRREFQRIQRLHQDRLVSDEEYEALSRELDQLKHEAALAELRLRRTVIRAPFAGTILERHLDAGASVSDGTHVYALATLEPLYADVNVPERHVPRLGVDQQVRLRADATGDEVGARIERIAPSVDPATGTVKITLAVKRPDGLRPGAFVRVDIVTDTHEDALIVPRSALVAEGRRWNLFRLSEDRAKVEQLEVELGYENGDRVEIAEESARNHGLEAGTPIVVTGAAALSNDAPVQVVD